MKRITIIGLFLVLVFNLSGCPPEDETAALRLSNHSSHTLTTLNITPEDASSWGQNYLNNSLPPGYYKDIKGLTPGYYDLRTISSTGASATRFGVYFGEDEHLEWVITNSKTDNLSDELKIELSDAVYN